MNISLIGMMGSGKTTVGKILAKKLNFTFVDTDKLIVDMEKISINEIFSIKGESYFRGVESKILADVLLSKNQVVSTGGGIIKLDENIQLLKEKSLVFYLQADTDTLIERVRNNTERPLLNVENVKEKMVNLLNDRLSKYNEAHYIVDTENKLPDSIADEIIGKINEYGRS